MKKKNGKKNVKNGAGSINLAVWKNWVDMHNKLCTNPMVAEFSLHFMVIGRKK